jgi:hypothetical protein
LTHFLWARSSGDDAQIQHPLTDLNSNLVIDHLSDDVDDGFTFPKLRNRSSESGMSSVREEYGTEYCAVCHDLGHGVWLPFKKSVS